MYARKTKFLQLLVNSQKQNRKTQKSNSYKNVEKVANLACVANSVATQNVIYMKNLIMTKKLTTILLR